VKIGPGCGPSTSGSFEQGLYPIAKNTCRAIGCYSTSHFYTSTFHEKIQQIGKLVPRKLNDRQMERRQNTCEILLARQKRKSFLHRIMTDDGKWIYFENPKSKNSWIEPGQPSISSKTKSFRTEDVAVLLVGIVYYEM